MFSRLLVAIILSVLATLTFSVTASAPATAQSTASYRAELNQLTLDMRALWGEVERFTVKPRYCLPPGTPNKAPDQAALDALEARVNALNARYNQTKQGLNDFLTTNTRLHGELMANGVDPRDRRWWTRYDTSRDKMVNELRAKKAALALKKEINCSPPPPPGPVVAATPPTPLPLRPSIDPLGWPSMPPHFCSWEEYWKFIIEQINPRYERAAEDAEKAARFRTQVEVQVNNLVQQGKPIPPALAALRRQAIADVAKYDRLSAESEDIRRRAKAIPVIDCRQPQTQPPAQDLRTGQATTKEMPRWARGLDAIDQANVRTQERIIDGVEADLKALEDMARRRGACGALFDEADDIDYGFEELADEDWFPPSMIREWRSRLDKIMDDCPAPRTGGPYRYETPLRIFIPPPNSVEGRILDVHNKERAAVGVAPLRWDPRIAASASAYAQQLARGGPFVHAPRTGRENERENLSRGLPGASAERMMINWTGEKRNFIPGTYPNVSKTGSWYDVSHYTQMIWPTTTHVGCGTARGAGQEVLVCRYTPPGNRDGTPVIARDRDAPPDAVTPINPRDIPKLPMGGGMQQIDPPPPPPPTARDDAPEGDEARHPLVTYVNNAFNQHGTETDCGNNAMARLELEKMRYALEELKKRLKAARKTGGFSSVKPQDVQRQIDEVERKIRFAEQRRRGDVCPPEWRPPPPSPPPPPPPPP